LATLRRAWTAWQEIQAPFEAARARVLIGLAHRAVGDMDTAELELGGVRVFRELGAAPEVARVEGLSRMAAPVGAGALTAREVQVLRLVAAGKTNGSIAAALGSANTPSPAMCRTSSPSSTSRRGRPQQRSPSSTACCDPCGQN
jgi:hypothetical protein